MYHKCTIIYNLEQLQYKYGMRVYSPQPYNRKDIIMMRTNRVVLSLVILAIFTLGVSAAGAQQALQEPYPIGTVKIEIKEISAGIGVSWGSGVLTFQGKDYPFKIKGLNVAAVGISKVEATGDVYNLTKASDLAGKYAAIAAGVAVIKGPAGTLMRNTNGVVINLKSVQTGIQLSLGVEGLNITME